MPRKRIPKKIKKAAAEYLNIITADNLPVYRAFIFGSQVKGSARPDSDLDIAIVSDKFMDSFSATLYLLNKAHDLPNPPYCIEPHGIPKREFTDENPLVWEIKKTGIRIK